MLNDPIDKLQIARLADSAAIRLLLYAVGSKASHDEVAKLFDTLEGQSSLLSDPDQAEEYRRQLSSYKRQWVVMMSSEVSSGA